MAGKNKRVAKRLFFVLFLVILVALIYFIGAIYTPAPSVDEDLVNELQRKEVSPGFYKIKNSWLKQSNSGLYEMYVEGDGFERGVINGKLTKELAEEQETVFISQIKKLIPSDSYLNFLKYFVAYFNRNITDHITEEYQQEIYGVALSASDKYDRLAPKYYRILNYHSAHDIGHALQDKNMTVGCTSFGALNNKTENGKLLLGRNFDFFAGDDFAKNKIVCFTKPETGHSFMYLTWAGFTGVVSGMNDQGLTVTINASKSDIPSSAATPISLLAKEILQYAGNIGEAKTIAEKRKTFVSETIFIGSAADRSCALIEKSPTRMDVVHLNGDELICSNHFRSDAFKNDFVNHKNIVESSSLYRYYRMTELLHNEGTLDPPKAAEILRNQDGLNDKKIGLTNEKGINQLLAHHSVIFSPEEKKVWVSTSPYQLGKYVCYDLGKIFTQAAGLSENREIIDQALTIPEDPFLSSQKYKQFVLFKQLRSYIEFCTDSKFDLKVESKFLEAFKNSNPESYLTHWVMGNYYTKAGDTSKARAAYNTALSKEVATQKEKRQISEQLKELDKK